eukprot:UN01429
MAKFPFNKGAKFLTYYPGNIFQLFSRFRQYLVISMSYDPKVLNECKELRSGALFNND